MARRRQFRPRVRTIYRNVATRVRRYRPRKKKNNMLLIGLAIAGVAGFLYKDKLKALLPSKV